MADRVKILDQARSEDPFIADELALLLQFENRCVLVDRAPAVASILEPLAPPGRMFEAGETVAARYGIVRFLGAGGFGEVYEAQDRDLDTVVAIKTLRSELAGDERFASRFRQEILLARQVTHYNACRIYDIVRSTSSRGRPVTFFSMEYLAGETLSERIRKGPLDRDAALGVLRQVVAGLGAAHSAQVIHRDFKMPT